jgi:hypothetical protein
MEVCREDGVGVDLDAAIVNGSGDTREKPADVGASLEQGPASDTPVHHMMKKARSVAARSARHDSSDPYLARAAL